MRERAAREDAPAARGGGRAPSEGARRARTHAPTRPACALLARACSVYGRRMRGAAASGRARRFFVACASAAALLPPLLLARELGLARGDLLGAQARRRRAALRAPALRGALGPCARARARPRGAAGERFTLRSKAAAALSLRRCGRAAHERLGGRARVERPAVGHQADAEDGLPALRARPRRCRRTGSSSSSSPRPRPSSSPSSSSRRRRRARRRAARRSVVVARRRRAVELRVRR